VAEAADSRQAEVSDLVRIQHWLHQPRAVHGGRCCCIDTRTAHPFSISAFGRRFNFSSAAPSDAYSGFLEFSVKHPVQRSEWGLAKVVATTDDGGVQVLHRHHSDAGGVFVMSSLSPEQDSGMPPQDLQAWFKGLLSLCGEQY
jgi:hypothetical protein